MHDVLQVTPGGAAAVRNCLAYLECRVAMVHEAGDHQIVIGLVEDGDAVDGMLPLLHWRRQYYSLPSIE
jgi:flavin reductase (DIM6/NTAB) family NADH-FMN oxidoreductase RutF